MNPCIQRCLDALLRRLASRFMSIWAVTETGPMVKSLISSPWEPGPGSRTESGPDFPRRHLRSTSSYNVQLLASTALHKLTIYKTTGTIALI